MGGVARRVPYNGILWTLAGELLREEELGRLRGLISPLSFDRLLEFDEHLGGPGMHCLDVFGEEFSVDDWDVFRPFKYCYMHLSKPREKAEWSTRYVVHMCGLHLELLLKRVARCGQMTLGQGVHNPTVARKLDPVVRRRIGLFVAVYNAAKHAPSPPPEEPEHEGDVLEEPHLFSVEDAVLAYVVCRRLARYAYPHARLKTPRSVWWRPPGVDRFPPIPET